MTRPFGKRRTPGGFRIRFGISSCLLAGVLLVAGCGGKDAAAVHKSVLVLGDSLAAGYGLPAERAFPAVLQRLLHEKGYRNVTVTADAVSGSTSDSGPPRLRRRLSEGSYDVLVLELGANDGLRGWDPARTKANLVETIRLAREAGLTVLLAGMRIPPRGGFAFRNAFARVYEELEKEEGVARIPFLLEGVAARPSLNLDGLHPNAEGHEKVARTVLRHLEPLLRTGEPVAPVFP